MLARDTFVSTVLLRLPSHFLQTSGTPCGTTYLPPLNRVPGRRGRRLGAFNSLRDCRAYRAFLTHVLPVVRVDDVVRTHSDER